MEELVITFGAVTIAWASVQMGVIQILKGIRINGNKLLGSDSSIWLANGILGAIGIFIAAVVGDTPVLAALLQALLAFFAASGEHNFLDMTNAAGKESSGKSLETTRTTLPANGDA